MKEIINKIKDYFTVSDSFVDHFRFLEIWLKCTGVNIFDRKWFWAGNVKVKLLCIFFMCYMTSIAVFSAIAIAYPIQNYLENNLTSAISLLFGIHVLAKYSTLMYKRKEYRRIKSSVVHHVQEARSGSNLMYRPVLFKYERYAKFVLKCITILYWCTGICIAVYPLLFGKQWMFPVNFPIPGVPQDRYPGYAINYVNITFALEWVVIAMIGFDGFMFLISLYLASRFEFCGECYRRIGDISDAQYSKMPYLKYCVDLHEQTIELHALIKNVFEPVIANELVSLIGAMGLEMITILVNPFNSFYLLALCSITEACLFCVCGELVAYKAGEVSMQIYSSNWYELDDIAMKKILIVRMLRCQQRFDFDIQNYALNMETFTNLCTTAFKCFNAMRDFIAKKA